MGTKENFNASQALKTILEKHNDNIDAHTVFGYLSYLSFLSLMDLHQAAPRDDQSNDNLPPSPDIDQQEAKTNNNSNLFNQLSPLLATLGKDPSLSSLVSGLSNNKDFDVNSIAPLLSSLGGKGSLPSILSLLGNKTDLAPILSLLSGKETPLANLDKIAPLLSLLGGKKSTTAASSQSRGKNQLGSLLSLLGDQSKSLPLDKISPILALLNNPQNGKRSKSRSKKRGKAQGVTTFPLQDLLALAGNADLLNTAKTFLPKLNNFNIRGISSFLAPLALTFLFLKSPKKLNIT